MGRKESNQTNKQTKYDNSFSLYNSGRVLYLRNLFTYISAQNKTFYSLNVNLKYVFISKENKIFS